MPLFLEELLKARPRKFDRIFFYSSPLLLILLLSLGVAQMPFFHFFHRKSLTLLFRCLRITVLFRNLVKCLSGNHITRAGRAIDPFHYRPALLPHAQPGQYFLRKPQIIARTKQRKGPHDDRFYFGRRFVGVGRE